MPKGWAILSMLQMPKTAAQHEPMCCKTSFYAMKARSILFNTLRKISFEYQVARLSGCHAFCTAAALGIRGSSIRRIPRNTLQVWLGMLECVQIRI